MRCEHCGEEPATVGKRLCVTCMREVEFWESYDNIVANFQPCIGCGDAEHGDLSCLSQGVLKVAS